MTAGIIGSGALDLQGASSPRRVSHAVLIYSIILLMLMQKRNPLWRAFSQITDRLELPKDFGPDATKTQKSSTGIACFTFGDAGIPGNFINPSLMNTRTYRLLTPSSQQATLSNTTLPP